jgi:hypothetical protein
MCRIRNAAETDLTVKQPFKRANGWAGLRLDMNVLKLEAKCPARTFVSCFEAKPR